MISAKKYFSFHPVFFPFLLIVFFSCTQPDSTTQLPAASNKPSSPKPETPLFNSDSAFEYTKAQVDFGPRAMNSKAHDNCANYLTSKLRSFADTVFVQQAQVLQSDKKKVSMQNIIASFSPENPNRILLCTHWDSRNWADQDSIRKNEPTDGANDGAAGVGVLLEIARVLQKTKPAIGVDIFLIDAEDQGAYENESTWCLGSQYWAKNPHIPGYFASYGILLDMVGAKDAVFTMESYSMQFAESTVKKVWDTGCRIGYPEYFSYQQTGPITDDHFYINTLAHIPCIDIIQHDPATPSKFYKNWHTHSDKLEFIDKNSLKAVGQTLMEVLFSE